MGYDLTVFCRFRGPTGPVPAGADRSHFRESPAPEFGRVREGGSTDPIVGWCAVPRAVTPSETFEKVAPDPPGDGTTPADNNRTNDDDMLSGVLSRFKDVLRGGGGSSGPLLPVTVSVGDRCVGGMTDPSVTKPPVSAYRAVAPVSPVREEGLGWAEAGWRQPGVVVFVSRVSYVY